MAERNPLVEEWILKAEGDWDGTEIDVALITPPMSDGNVYHLQQCVEKLFKALLLQMGQTFREILELKEMAGRLRQALLLRLGLNPQEPTP